MSGGIGFLGLRSRFDGSGPSFNGTLLLRDQLRQLGLPLVEFRVEHPNLSKVSSLEG